MLLWETAYLFIHSVRTALNNSIIELSKKKLNKTKHNNNNNNNNNNNESTAEEKQGL